MRNIVAIAFSALMAAAGIEANAQDAYPSQVVKLVVPAAAGSTTDTLARLVADQLSRKWGKAAVVENSRVSMSRRRVAIRAAPPLAKSEAS